MSDDIESLDSVLYEFSDGETALDLTVRPMPAMILRLLIGRQLLPEQAYSRRDDLGEVSAICRDEEQLCLRVKDFAGAAYCLGNLALIAKIREEAVDCLKFAEEAQRLAKQVGLTELVTRMQTLRESNGSGGDAR